MNLFIFVIIVSLVALGTAQYYYVQQPTLYFPPIQQNTYFPRHHYQPFVNIPSVAAPVPEIQRTTFTPHVPQVQRTTFAQNNDMEYRGFAYHTRNDNGATSHVLFVTGPQAQQINSRVFNNFQQDYKENVNHAKTVASEMLDPLNKMSEQNVLPQNIQDLYTPPMMQKVSNNNPFTFFQNMFQNTQNPTSRVINFYSRNTDLFASQVPGYPANVAPLPYNINAINPRILSDDQQNQTKSNEQSIDKNNEEAAESIITNTRFKFNNNNKVENIIEKLNKNEININNINENQLESLPTTIVPLEDSSQVTSELFLPILENTSTSDSSTQQAEVGSVSPENPTTSTSELPSTVMAEKSSEILITTSAVESITVASSIVQSTTETSSTKDKSKVDLEEFGTEDILTTENNEQKGLEMIDASSTEDSFTTVRGVVEDDSTSETSSDAFEATTVNFFIRQRSVFKDLGQILINENDKPLSAVSDNSVSEMSDVNSTNERTTLLSTESSTKKSILDPVSDDVKYSQDLMPKVLSSDSNRTSETLDANTENDGELSLITELDNNVITTETTSTEVTTSEHFMTTVTTENYENIENAHLFTSTLSQDEVLTTEIINENINTEIISTTQTTTVDQ